MGRGGGGKGRGGGDKTESYFQAIESQKIDTVRWSLIYGGITLSLTTNDNGETGIMVAASGGKEKSLEVMLDQVQRMRSRQDRSECLDARGDEGKTPLMMAAANGRTECIRMLMAAGANVNLKDDEGYTARARADWAGKQAAVDALDGKDSEPSEEEVESDGGFEGETAGQRRKRKKAEKSGGPALSCSSQRNAKGKDDKDDKDGGPVVEQVEPVLQEIKDALAAAKQEEKTTGTVKELKMSLVRTEDSQAPGLVDGAMDPALWCVGNAVRHLAIRWKPGLDVGALDKIHALKRILHLAVQDSNLPSLPEALVELKEMRSLEVDGNRLTSFPSNMKKLASTLESVSAARNKLTSKCLDALAPLDHLVSLKLDHNELKDLEDLDLNAKPHLVTLSVAHNKLTELPEDPWSSLTMLQHLNVSENQIKELPCEMGEMKEKKLTDLLLHDNPWKDGKIRNMIENSAVLSNVVLVYLRKQKPKGNKKPKGKPKRKPKEESDYESEPEAVEEPKPVSEEEEEEVEPLPEKEKKSKKEKKDKKEKKAKRTEDDDEEEAAERDLVVDEDDGDDGEKEKKKKKDKKEKKEKKDKKSKKTEDDDEEEEEDA